MRIASHLIHSCLDLNGLNNLGDVSNRDLERELHQLGLPCLLGGEEFLRTERWIHSLWPGRRKSKDSMKKWSREEKGRGYGERKRGSGLWYLFCAPRVLRVTESPERRSRGRQEMPKLPLCSVTAWAPGSVCPREADGYAAI